MLRWLRAKLLNWLLPDLAGDLSVIRTAIARCEIRIDGLHSRQVADSDNHNQALADLATELNALRNKLADNPPTPAQPRPRLVAWSEFRAAATAERKSA